MASKKRVLIITYYWPPSGGSGVQRWLKFSKYLPEFGYQPVIYTPENPAFDVKDDSLLKDVPLDIEVIKTKIIEPFHLFRFLGIKSLENSGVGNRSQGNNWKSLLMKWIRGNVFIPDPRILWVKPSIKFLKKYLDTNPVDIFVTTGPPHSIHLIGLGLKKELDIKWIADFRDPFSQMDVYDEYNTSQLVRDRLKILEGRILQKCDVVLVTSYSIDEMLVDFDKSKMVTITNGYDPDDYQEMTPLKLKLGSIKILHAGTLGQARNPIGLWSALEQLNLEISDLAEKIHIEFVGNTDVSIIDFVKSHSVLKNLVTFTPYLSHQDLNTKYNESSVLLLAIHKTQVGKVCIPGKLFEYMAMNKVILAFGDLESDAARIISEYNVGHTFSYTDGQGIREIIQGFIIQKTNLTGNRQLIDGFTRRNLTQKLSELMNKIISFNNK